MLLRSYLRILWLFRARLVFTLPLEKYIRARWILWKGIKYWFSLISITAFCFTVFVGYNDYTRLIRLISKFEYHRKGGLHGCKCAYVKELTGTG